jgi:glutamate racemase
MDNRPIGVFDSGVGGLTVVREILRTLPSEKIIYIGDTARVPWGVRGRKTIVHFSCDLAGFLMKKRVKVIVVACHTASSVALSALKNEVKVSLFGVIEPSVREAVTKTRNLRIGLVGTPATVKASAWEKALKKIRPKVKVFAVSCPLFVPLVEEGLVDHRATRILAREYLQPLVKEKIDTLILGCTHYPLLEKTIKEVIGDVALVSPGKATASVLKHSLDKNKLQGKHKKPIHELYFTDLSYQALDNLEKFSGRLGHVRIKGVSLERL